MNTTTVKNMRKKFGMTQAQFAKALRMSPAWVGAVESGRIEELRTETVEKIRKLKARRK